MSSAKLVHQALKTFNQPVTRAQIQQETGLDRHGVHAGLRRLKELGAIKETGAGERFRGLYELVPGANIKFPDRRQRADKDADLREVIEALETVLEILSRRLKGK